MQVQKEAEEISGIALFDEFRGPGFGQKFAEGRFVEQPWQYRKTKKEADLQPS